MNMRPIILAALVACAGSQASVAQPSSQAETWAISTEVEWTGPRSTTVAVRIENKTRAPQAFGRVRLVQWRKRRGKSAEVVGGTLGSHTKLSGCDCSRTAIRLEPGASIEVLRSVAVSMDEAEALIVEVELTEVTDAGVCGDRVSMASLAKNRGERQARSTIAHKAIGVTEAPGAGRNLCDLTWKRVENLGAKAGLIAIGFCDDDGFTSGRKCDATSIYWVSGRDSLRIGCNESTCGPRAQSRRLCIGEVMLGAEPTCAWTEAEAKPDKKPTPP